MTILEFLQERPPQRSNFSKSIYLSSCKIVLISFLPLGRPFIFITLFKQNFSIKTLDLRLNKYFYCMKFCLGDACTNLFFQHQRYPRAKLWMICLLYHWSKNSFCFRFWCYNLLECFVFPRTGKFMLPFGIRVGFGHHFGESLPWFLCFRFSIKMTIKRVFEMTCLKLNFKSSNR